MACFDEVVQSLKSYRELSNIDIILWTRRVRYFHATVNQLRSLLAQLISKLFSAASPSVETYCQLAFNFLPVQSQLGIYVLRGMCGGSLHRKGVHVYSTVRSKPDDPLVQFEKFEKWVYVLGKCRSNEKCRWTARLTCLIDSNIELPCLPLDYLFLWHSIVQVRCCCLY